VKKSTGCHPDPALQEKDLRSCFWFKQLRRTARMLLPQGGISMTDPDFFAPSVAVGYPALRDRPSADGLGALQGVL
jgi:hypothetical protein